MSTSLAKPNPGMFKRRQLESPPWIVWIVWSRDIHQHIEQHIEDNHRFLSRLYLARMFYDKLNAWGLPFDPKDDFLPFQISKIRKLEDKKEAGFNRVILNLKEINCADNSLETPPEEWIMNIHQQLAGVLADILEPNDYIMLWGGRPYSESKVITLNLTVNSTNYPKVYVAVYRHGEMQPKENKFNQYHIPFNSRPVCHSFIKKHGLDDTTVQKICPAIYPITVESVELLDYEDELTNSQELISGLGANTSSDKHSETLRSKSDSSNCSKSKSKSSISQVVELREDPNVISLSDGDASSVDTNSNLNDKTPRSSTCANANMSNSTLESPARPFIPFTRRNIRRHGQNKPTKVDYFAKKLIFPTDETQPQLPTDKTVASVSQGSQNSTRSQVSGQVDQPVVSLHQTLKNSTPTGTSAQNQQVDENVASHSQKSWNSPRSGTNSKEMQRDVPEMTGKTRTSSSMTSEEIESRAGQKHSASQLKSQDFLIGLNTQQFTSGSEPTDVEISQNANVVSEDVEENEHENGLLLVGIEPGMSQYSMGRMLNEMDNNVSSANQEIDDQRNSESDDTDITVEREPFVVLVKRVCDLKKIRLFHLRCKILKIHLNDAEKIGYLRVSDNTLPPFFSKELMPISHNSPCQDQEALLMATLEIDILIRNANRLKGVDTKSHEVLLTYVCIERDKDRVLYFTMDGNRSEIQDLELPKESEIGKEGRVKGTKTKQLKDDEQTSKTQNKNKKTFSTPPKFSYEDSSVQDIPLAETRKKRLNSHSQSKKGNPASKINTDEQLPGISKVLTSQKNKDLTANERLKPTKEPYVSVERLDVSKWKENAKKTRNPSQSSQHSQISQVKMTNPEILNPSAAMRTRSRHGSSHPSEGHDPARTGKNKQVSYVEELYILSDTDSEDSNSDGEGNNQAKKRKLDKS